MNGRFKFIFQLLIAAYIFTLPFKASINNFVLILIIIASIFIIKKAEFILIIGKNRIVQLFSLYLLGCIITLFWSANTNYGIEQIGRKLSIFLSLLVLPILFKSFSLRSISYIYLFPWIIASVFSLISTWNLLGQRITDLSYFSFMLPDTININSNYYAIYVSMGIFLLLDSLRDGEKTKYKIVKIGICIYLFLFVALLSSRTVFFACCVVLMLTPFILSKFSFRSKFAALCSILMTSVIVFISIPYLRNRTIQPLMEGVEKSQRYQMAKAGVQIFFESPIVGVGVGDTQDRLNYYYNLNGFSEGLIENYNVHNEFLNNAMVGGILMFSVFIFIMFESFRVAIQQGSIAPIAFCIIFFSSCLTEALLSRQKGLVFFFFFVSLLLFNNNEENPAR